MKASLEKITVAPEQSFVAFEYREASFDAPWHFHPEYELTYIKSSSGIRYVGNHLGDFEPGDLVLLGANLPHCWRNVSTGDEPANSLVIQWGASFPGAQPEFRAIRKMMTAADRGIRFSERTSQQVSEQMAAIINAEPLEAYLLLVRLLDELTRAKDPRLLADRAFSYDGSSRTGDRLQRIQQFVTGHYQRKITLAEVAAQVNLSEQSFSRFFSQSMGRPFFRFLNEYRINMACRLLLETDANVANVGYDCGYDTLPFFYREFGRLKGCTPGQFRKFRGAGARVL
ncbi:AraC family transcriptional regulator [Neolewinella persica]|uniref:AraC family transcriptional regulator n=1 Tax=Neolewinella persica TaxID=70998 RepID=UPI00036F2BA7|nr:AraC family transcriptional regulator [Neolewinella persica]